MMPESGLHILIVPHLLPSPRPLRTALQAASAPPASLPSPPQDCPFVVRGPTYLKDRKKIPAGMAAFTLGAMDMVAIDSPVQHIARFLPSIR